MIKRASTGAFGAAERGEQVSQRFCKALRHPIALQQPQVRARFVVVATSSDARTAQAPVLSSQVEMLAAPRGPANMSTSAHISWGKHYRMIWHSLSDGRRLDVRRYGPLTRGAAPGAQTHCHN